MNKKKKHQSLRRLALSVAAMVPEMLSSSFSVSKALKLTDPSVRAVERRDMNRVYKRLIEQGHLVSVQKGDVRFYNLTDKGRELARRFEYSNVRLKPKKGWDGQWRIIIFDIPERMRVKRNILRDALKRIGFIKLQHSVWVYPHDVSDLLILIRKDLSLYRHVLYILADTIERERDIAERFGLERYL